MSRRQKPVSAEFFDRVVTACDSKIEKLEAQIGRFRSGIEALLSQHRPRPDEDGLRPGNSRSEVRFWCTQCSTPWPCRTFNGVRRLYGEAVGWPAASRPYEPLVLHLSDAIDQPDSTDGPDRG